MLEERDERGGHGNDLLRADIHVLNGVATLKRELVHVTATDQIVGEGANAIELGIGLRDDVLAFLDGREIVDLVGDAATLHTTVRRLEEAIAVRAGVDGQRVDQTDVWSFRRFDGANATVVRRVHVAHFEAGTFASQTAWA